jgi:Na+-driven multidrug efflux pump
VVLWLAAPLMVAQLVHVSYNLVDALWLSRLYEGALAVPRQVWPTLMFFYAIAMALSTANLAMISQYVGAERYDMAGRTASKLLTFNLALASAICLTYYTLRPYIFTYITTVPPELYNDVMVYSNVMLLDIFFTYLGTAFTTVLQAIGDTRTPTYISVAGALLNIGPRPGHDIRVVRLPEDGGYGGRCSYGGIQSPGGCRSSEAIHRGVRRGKAYPSETR